MLCRSCGNWTPDNFVTCNYCGSQMAPANPSVPQTPLPASLPSQQTGQSTPLSPLRLWQSPPRQPMASGEHGIQQTVGDLANPPGTYPLNSGSVLPYGTNPSWPNQQPGQASDPEYPSSWPQPFQAAPSPLQEPSWSQPFSQNQLQAQASTGGSSPAPNRVQHLLIQLFQPSLAANPWLGVIIGGMSPALLGALFFVILLAIQHPSSSAGGLNALNTFAFSPTGIIPMDSAVRNGLQALLTAQGVSRHIVGNYTGTGGNVLLNVDLASPLQIALLFPALFLVMGGYLAACTDMQNRTVASLWRGAAISLPYMLLLFLLSTQVKGDISSSLLSQSSSSGSAFGFLQSQISFMLSMNSGSLVMLTLFWGTLFGLLGASLKLARGHWRIWLRNFLRSNAQSRLTAILAGGLVAILIGFLFSLLLTYVAMASNMQLMQGSACHTGNVSGSLMTSDVNAGPMEAMQLFAFSFGTPISLNLHVSGMSAITDLFAASGCMGQTSFSLFGGIAHSSPWLYLLLILPVISLFAGGRVSAHLGQPASLGIAAIQGAFIAIPFTIMMMILAALSMLSASMDITGNVSFLGNIPDTQITVSLGAGVVDVMVWSLLIGAFVGALGGIYQASALSGELDFALAQLGKALASIAKPAYALIDQLDTRRPATRVHGRTLNILAGALLISLLLTVLSVALGVLLISFSSVVTFDLNHRLHSIMNALLIALPGLLLVCTLISALFEDPQGAPETHGMSRANPR